MRLSLEHKVAIGAYGFVALVFVFFAWLGRYYDRLDLTNTIWVTVVSVLTLGVVVALVVQHKKKAEAMTKAIDRIPAAQHLFRVNLRRKMPWISHDEADEIAVIFREAVIARVNAVHNDIENEYYGRN